ncbi:hypothetical protein PSPO01_14419 [Paraphaeosphaeria sporulosa]
MSNSPTVDRPKTQSTTATTRLGTGLQLRSAGARSAGRSRRIKQSERSQGAARRVATAAALLTASRTGFHLKRTSRCVSQFVQTVVNRGRKARGKLLCSAAIGERERTCSDSAIDTRDGIQDACMHRHAAEAHDYFVGSASAAYYVPPAHVSFVAFAARRIIVHMAQGN